MLLRRITEHVREQNWLAIVLDFIIVVMGVFVGLQVSNWNDLQKRKAGEIETLERLLEETENAVVYWQGVVESSARDNVNREIFIRDLHQGVLPQEDRDAFDDAILRMGFYPAIFAPRAVYNELIASGGLQLVSDPAAREAISASGMSYDLIQGQLIQFRTNLPELFSTMKGRVFSVYDPDVPSRRRYQYDFDQLASDPLFKSVMTDFVRDHRQFHNYREWNLEATIRMCRALAEVLERTCQHRAPGEDDVTLKEGVNAR